MNRRLNGSEIGESLQQRGDPVPDDSGGEFFADTFVQTHAEGHLRWFGRRVRFRCCGGGAGEWAAAQGRGGVRIDGAGDHGISRGEGDAGYLGGLACNAVHVYDRSASSD